jgi:hypothetical protein
VNGKVDPGLLYEELMFMFPESVKYTRQVYGILDLLGDLGGVTEVIMICFGIFLFPISEHSFTMKAAQKFFLARTKENSLLMAKKSKFTEETAIPKNQMGNEFYLNELKMHRYICVSPKDNFLLYLANQLGKCFPANCWSKKKKLQRLYEKGADKIESRLNIVKINQNQTDVKVLLKKFNSMMDQDTIFNIRH